MAANAYAQYTGLPSVCFVTAGPGGTNLITPIAEAWIDSIPLIVITGQCKSHDINYHIGVRQGGVQEVDIQAITHEITKYTKLVTNTIDYYLDQAWYRAITERPGPVVLSIPLDIQNMQVKDIKSVNPVEKTIDKEALRNAKILLKRLIGQSRKPIFLIGNGCRNINNLELQLKSIGIPILTTWKAADLIAEDNPLFMGRPGTLANRYANIIQQNADLIICVGARLDNGQVAFNLDGFAQNAIKVIVDIDINESKKFNRERNFIIQEAKDFFDTIKNIKKDCKDWIKKCKQVKKKFWHHEIEYNKDFVNTYDLIYKLSYICNKNTIIIIDSSGSASEITQQAWKIRKGQRMICSPGLGSMGCNIPHAIGACIASNKKTTIVIAGDGSIQMNIQELQTIQNNNLPIKIFVLNNNGYASIRNTHKKFFGKVIGCDDKSGIMLPDLSDIAFAYNFEYYRITQLDSQSVNYIGFGLDNKKPMIIEVMVDPDLQSQPKAISTPGEKVNMERMWPHVDERELKL
jgi:acetolactate synthase-1/2/3 large subunit